MKEKRNYLQDGALQVCWQARGSREEPGCCCSWAQAWLRDLVLLDLHGKRVEVVADPEAQVMDRHLRRQIHHHLCKK